MFSMILCVASASFASLGLQSADVKDKPAKAVPVDPALEGAMRVHGYPGSRVLHYSITDRRVNNFVFSTTDPIDKVAAYYERNVFFVDDDAFRKELRAHPVTGRIENIGQYGTSIFYYRNVPEGLCYYALGINNGLTTAATITAANGVTRISVHWNGFVRPTTPVKPAK